MAAEPQQQSDDPTTVADPEEYNQTSRLRAINNARQRVENTLEQSANLEATESGFGREDRRKVVRAVVYSYISNLFWLMAEADREDLLVDVGLGEIVLEPPQNMVQLVRSNDRGYPRVVGSPSVEAETFHIMGLRDYMGAPEIFEHTWTLQIQDRHGQPEPMSHTEQSLMPVNISKNAFHTANRFCNESGIDVAFDSGKPHGEI